MTRPPLSALSRVGELGVSRTLESLGRLTNETWESEAFVVEAFDGRVLTPEGGDNVFAVQMSWSGSCVFVMLSEKEALDVARTFLFNNVEPGEDFLDRREELMTELGESAVGELANVVIHASANAWADACGKGFLLLAPKLWRGAAPDVEASALAALRERVPEVAAVVGMRLRCPRLGARCEIRFFLGPAASAELARADKA